MLEIVHSFETSSENQKEFEKAKSLLSDFFHILLNDARFNKEILSKLRN